MPLAIKRLTLALAFIALGYLAPAAAAAALGLRVLRGRRRRAA